LSGRVRVRGDELVVERVEQAELDNGGVGLDVLRCG
jgi:hypothetical protein